MGVGGGAVEQVSDDLMRFDLRAGLEIAQHGGLHGTAGAGEGFFVNADELR